MKLTDETEGDPVEDIDNNIITGLIEHVSKTWGDGGNCAYIGDGCFRIYFTVCSLVFMEIIYITNKIIEVLLKIIDWFHLHTHFSHNLDWQHK